MELLKRHTLSIHEKQYNKRRTTCDICGKEMSVVTIERHRATHAVGEDRLKLRAQCDICFKWFSTVKSLWYHKKFFHIDEKLECEECHKVFASKPSLTEHINRKHRERPHKCTHCPCKFSKAYQLKVSYEKCM